MPRETAVDKAKRLLAEGRMIVREVGRNEKNNRIIAECRGDSGTVYLLGWDPAKDEWRCSCPNVTGNCSHLAALKLVVLKP